MINKGFTLLELLICLVICGLLLITVNSSWYLFKKNNEKIALVNRLQTIIDYAKSVALANGQLYKLIPLSEDRDWSKAISLKSVSNNQLAYQWDAHYSSWKLTWHGLDSDKELLINGTTHAMSNGSFFLSDNKGVDSIQIRVNKLGRILVINPK